MRSYPIRLAGTQVLPQDEIKYLGFQKSSKDKSLHPKARLHKARNTLRLVQQISRELTHLPTDYKLNMATACIDAVYLYGLEITSGKEGDKITKKADILRRRALRTIMQAPIGTANEIL